MKIILSAIYFLIALAVTSHSNVCAQSAHQNTAALTLELQNVAGKKPLVLRNESYTNEAGEKFNITTFNYFISNIKLHRAEGKEYIIPQDSSYFLVKENEPASKKINLKIPEGIYTAITFTIGVDSLRSTMDISRRTGALDISGGMLEGMYWTWNSGYIFVKLEGECEQAQTDRTGQKKFRYHIGGFGGYNKPSLNNIRTVTVNFSRENIIKAQNGQSSRVLLQADALRVFNGKTRISIAKNSAVMFGDFSKLVADNYTSMFSHVSTSN